MSGLALLYKAQGKYAQAKPLYQRALRIWERQLRSTHPETARDLHDFASFQEAQGYLPEALPLYQRALAISEQEVGAHHPKTMQIRKHLIALLHAMGQHEKAGQLEEFQSELGAIYGC